MQPAIRQETARLRLAELYAHPSTVWAIHYACQSFYQGERLGSPRVTAIAVCNLATGQSQSFSFHQIVELRRLTPARALRYVDAIELELLEAYFEFARLNRNMRFLHWHMRDASFGFRGARAPLSGAGRRAGEPA